MSDPYLRHDGSNRDDMFICVLCSTGSMHRKNIRGHLDGWWHRLKLQHEGLKERALKVDSLSNQIERLGHIRWKEHIKAALYDYVFNTDQDVHDIPSSIKQQLEKYTKAEKTSLLELAVWKASCLWFDGSGSFNAMQDILDQWAMDDRFDPVAYKTARRFTGSVAVIMRCVIPFLDD